VVSNAIFCVVISIAILRICVTLRAFCVRVRLDIRVTAGIGSEVLSDYLR